MDAKDAMQRNTSFTRASDLDKFMQELHRSQENKTVQEQWQQAKSLECSRLRSNLCILEFCFQFSLQDMYFNSLHYGKFKLC